MTTKHWTEIQRQWQHDRELDFVNNQQQKVNNEISVRDNRVSKNEYSLCYTTFKDNRFCFSSFPDNIFNIDIVRHKNYIFDLSDQSNLGHKLVISRVPSSGKIKDLVYQGIPGFPGSFLSFYIGIGRPSKLYYYDNNYKGSGGIINIIN